MELKIEKKEQEPLLSRVKLLAEISFEKATPSYKEILPKLATAIKADEKLAVIKNVKTYFGARKAKVTAYIYDDEKSKEFIEPKKKVKAAKEEKEEKKEVNEENKE